MVTQADAPATGGWTLAIETSNPSVRGAAGRDESAAEALPAEQLEGPGVAAGVAGPDGAPRLLGVELLRPTGRHDDDLMPAIDRLTRRLGLEPAGLSRAVVSVGPGGFTGLRVAIATAKGLAIATGAVVVPVPTAAVAGRFVAESDRPALVLLASKRIGSEPTAWAELVGASGSAGSAAFYPQLVGAVSLRDAVERHGVRTLVADDALPPELEVGGPAVRRVPLRLGAAACLEAGWERAAVAASELRPLYSREPEAVRKWRELHG